MRTGRSVAAPTASRCAALSPGPRDRPGPGGRRRSSCALRTAVTSLTARTSALPVACGRAQRQPFDRRPRVPGQGHGPGDRHRSEDLDAGLAARSRSTTSARAAAVRRPRSPPWPRAGSAPRPARRARGPRSPPDPAGPGPAEPGPRCPPPRSPSRRRRPERTSATTASQRRSASSEARRSARSSSRSVSSSTAPAYPPSATGSAPGVATTSAGVLGTSGSTPPPLDCRITVLGKARPELLRGPIGADHRCPERAALTDRALPVGVQQPAPGTAEVDRTVTPVASVLLAERSVAAPAPSRLPAVPADQRHQIARARHLDQHRPLRQAGPDELEHLVRQPGRPGRRITGQGEVGVDGRPHARRGVPGLRPVGGQLPQPPPLHPLLGLAAARVAGRQHRAALLGRPQRQHRPGVRVRRPLLGEQVVTVVPQRHQAEIADRVRTPPPGSRSPPGRRRAAQPGRRGSGRPVRPRRSARRSRSGPAPWCRPLAAGPGHAGPAPPAPLPGRCRPWPGPPRQSRRPSRCWGGAPGSPASTPAGCHRSAGRPAGRIRSGRPRAAAAVQVGSSSGSGGR